MAFTVAVAYSGGYQCGVHVISYKLHRLGCSKSKKMRGVVLPNGQSTLLKYLGCIRVKCFFRCPTPGFLSLWKGYWQNHLNFGLDMGEAALTGCLTLVYDLFRLGTCLLLAITISGAVALLAILMPIKMETVCKSGSLISIYNSWWDVGVRLL